MCFNTSSYTYFALILLPTYMYLNTGVKFKIGGYLPTYLLAWGIDKFNTEHQTLLLIDYCLFSMHANPFAYNTSR